MKPKVTQVTLAERAHEEGVPGSDRSPTGVSSSAVWVSASCWREALQSAARKTKVLPV